MLCHSLLDYYDFWQFYLFLVGRGVAGGGGGGWIQRNWNGTPELHLYTERFSIERGKQLALVLV